MKTCKKCGVEKLVECFYEHKAMGDGRLSFCKDCVRARVRDHRDRNRDTINEYKRLYSRQEHVLARMRRYQRENPDVHAAANKRWSEANVVKKRAHLKVRRAVLAGRLQKKPCLFCGDERVEGHHENYNEPLVVVWLCTKHHREVHREYDPLPIPLGAEVRAVS